MNGNKGQWKTESSANKKTKKSSSDKPSASDKPLAPDKTSSSDKTSPNNQPFSSEKPLAKTVKFGLLRKKYEFKHACATPGCDGSGNVNTTMSNHRRQAAARF